MRRIVIVLMALFAMSFHCLEPFYQECVLSAGDEKVAREVMRDIHEADLKAGSGLMLSQMMVMAAEALVGTPYVAGTLDEDPVEEKLRIYLTKTDCILFVETCLALAKTVDDAGESEPELEDFIKNVARMRYRTDPPFSYGDRVHYTTEWVRRMEGTVLHDMTLELGGEVYDHPVYFMSSHPDSYKQLAEADDIPRAALNLRKIREVEEDLNRSPMTYIPKTKLSQASGQIKSGDIICFSTTIGGLDISHVGIAYVKDGVAGFIHASQKDGKVEIDSRTIEEYVRSRSNLSGIKVIRPL